MSGNNGNQEHPSLIGGHTEYIKGVAEATIGNVTGSEAWKRSGEKDKAHGMEAMKAAGQSRDPAAQGYGKAEEIVGKVTGCKGMADEGAASKKAE